MMGWMRRRLKEYAWGFLDMLRWLKSFGPFILYIGAIVIVVLGWYRIEKTKLTTPARIRKLEIGQAKLKRQLRLCRCPPERPKGAK